MPVSEFFDIQLVLRGPPVTLRLRSYSAASIDELYEVGRSLIVTRMLENKPPNKRF